MAGLRGLTSLVPQLESICCGALAEPWVAPIWLQAAPQSPQVVQEPSSPPQPSKQSVLLLTKQTVGSPQVAALLPGCRKH